ncbi:unnamed protein product [Caenorhabditis angaria]|uniref:Uncharacterized protein n=1 Tax=Caenorhabditis angaria TaxID=860376 RepID=A0A9P1NCE1_9PELO|nr:unnamed protein product [Caenorhabditis angaria]
MTPPIVYPYFFAVRRKRGGSGVCLCNHYIAYLAKIMSSKREATQDAPIEGGESSSSSSTTAKKPKAEGSEPTSTDTSTTTELAVSIPSVIPEAPGQIQESPNVQENVVVQPINEPNQECPTHPIGSSSTTNASNETNSAIGQRLLTQTDFDEVGDSSSSSTEDSPTHPIGSSSSTNSASNGATSAVVGEFVTPKELENETAKKPKAEGSEPTSTETSTTTELAVSIPSVIPEAPGQIQESPNVQENVVVQPINEPNQECPTHPIGSSSTTNASNETNSAIAQRLLTQTDFDEVGDSSSSSTQDSPTHPIGSSSSTNSASTGTQLAVAQEFVTPKELDERDWNARYDQTLLELGIGRIRPDGKTVVPFSIPFTQAVADLYGIDTESLQPEFGEGTLKMCTKLFDGKKSKASAKPSAGPSSSATPSTSSATAPQNQEEKEEEKEEEKKVE